MVHYLMVVKVLNINLVEEKRSHYNKILGREIVMNKANFMDFRKER